MMRLLITIIFCWSTLKDFFSRLINIDMDEAHMLRLGKYLTQDGYQDRVSILICHLRRVVEIAL